MASQPPAPIVRQDPPTGNPSAPKIRNIIQTVQEREIIKLAPDLTVYLNGTPFLYNALVQLPGSSTLGTTVTFNDYITAFSASYDTDQFIPSCSINLSVPNNMKFLFFQPGGLKLLSPMMDLQVFMKGYFLSNRGNSVYRRVFKGVLSSLSYVDNGKTLEITLSGRGILRFMELMQVELNPALMTNSLSQATPFSSKYWNMDPYSQIKALFNEKDFLQGFQTGQTTSTGSGGQINSGPYASAINAGYIAQWQRILANLRKYVHVYGTTPISATSTEEAAGPSTTTVPGPSPVPNPLTPADHYSSQAGANSADNGSKYGVLAESQWSQNLYLENIQKFLPDMGFSQLNLFTGRPTPRIERLRAMVDSIGFEGYQDIDGSIIIKPPLYNLDVNLLSDNTVISGGNPIDPNIAITAQTNPFIIHLSEIISESEIEDEAAIRYTRMLVKGNVDPQFQFGYDPSYLPTGEFVDVDKLAKFGLREDAIKTISWIPSSDISGLFATAVNETVKGNRGYRQYNITIPMRPELKLGFPVYLPHKDIYGYIKNVSLSYQTGGQATMSVVLDSIRRRPMIAETQTVGGVSTTLYTTHENLIYLWAAKNADGTSSTVPNVSNSAAATPAGNFSTIASQSATSFFSTSGNASASPTNPGSLLNSPGTLPTLTAVPLQPKKLADHVKVKMKNHHGTQPSDTIHSFYIQYDDTHALQNMPSEIISARTSNGGLFIQPNPVDKIYLESLRRAMPYTDGKGYEVISPFPWGRYVGLLQALAIFTQGSTIAPAGETTNTGSSTSVSNANAFLVSGTLTQSANGSTLSSGPGNQNSSISTTTGSGSSVEPTQNSVLQKNGLFSGSLDLISVYELVYDNNPTGGQPSYMNQGVNTTSTTAVNSTSTQNTTAVLLSGTTSGVSTSSGTGTSNNG